MRELLRDHSPESGIEPANQKLAILSPEREALIELLAGGDKEKEKLYKKILPEYWERLTEFKNSAEEERQRSGSRPKESQAEDYDEATDLAQTLIQNGVFPIVTVKKEYAQKLKEDGLTAQETWIPGERMIVGTLGLPPYQMEEDRVAFEIVDISPDAIEPRITGKDKTFQGVVAFKKQRIAPEHLRELSI